MADAPIRKPRSLNEAQRLCEGFAAIDGQIAAIEEARDVVIASANAGADKELAPLLAQRAAIAEKLEPWWGENSALLTHGKRKSAELGGAVLGTRKGKGKVNIVGVVDSIIESLRSTAWGRKFVRTRFELDKAKLAEGLIGKARTQLEAEGITYQPGAEVFFIERTGQAGTQAKVQR